MRAAIDAIVKYGYAGASSTRIAEISGLTRGAQKHHYRNKADLVANALVEIQSRHQVELLAEFDRIERVDIAAVLRALWKSQTSQLYMASLELRMAARSDEALRAVLVPAEQAIGRKQRDLLVELLDDGRHSKHQLLEAGELILNTLRGMALQRLLYTDTRRERRQLRVLEEAVRELLGSEPS